MSLFFRVSHKTRQRTEYLAFRRAGSFCWPFLPTFTHFVPHSPFSDATVPRELILIFSWKWNFPLFTASFTLCLFPWNNIPHWTLIENNLHNLHCKNMNWTLCLCNSREERHKDEHDSLCLWVCSLVLRKQQPAFLTPLSLIPVLSGLSIHHCLLPSMLTRKDHTEDVAKTLPWLQHFCRANREVELTHRAESTVGEECGSCDLMPSSGSKLLYLLGLWTWPQNSYL